MILFSLPSVNNLGFFDKIVQIKKWALDIVSGNLGFGYRQWELGLLILPMKIGFLILPTGTGLLILSMRIGF